MKPFISRTRDWIAKVCSPGKIDLPGMWPWGDWLTEVFFHPNLSLWRWKQAKIRELGNWLSGVSDPGEIDSASFLTLGRLTQQGVWSWGDWLSRVSDPGEIDSAGFLTLGRLTQQFFWPSCRLTHQGVWPRGDWLTRVCHLRRLTHGGLPPQKIDSSGGDFTKGQNLNKIQYYLILQVSCPVRFD